MAYTPSQAIIRGIPNRPDINMRGGPGTGYPIVFQAQVGATAAVIDVLPDATENNFQGKIYQWLHLRMGDGREGWARDDLLDLASGDCSAIGYGILTQQTYAFSLTRDISRRPPSYPPPVGPDAAASSAEEDAESASEPLWVPADQPPVEPPAAPPVTPPQDSSAMTQTPPVAPPVSQPAGCFCYVIGMSGAVNVRERPTTATRIVGQAERGLRLDILDIKPEEGGGAYRWIQVNVHGQPGWIREDLVTFRGADCMAKGLVPAADLYPAPMSVPDYWWVRGFEGPQPQHPGWDLGAAQGTPVLAGPGGGLVLVALTATKATPDKPRTLDHGLQLGDPSVFSDPGWGFGYGNYVIVRYTSDLLPEHSRRVLAQKGMEGGAFFVMYAHLHSLSVRQGQTLQPGQAIGACGTTGNSEAPHVHLEVRGSRNPSATGWAAMSPGLMDPGVLFVK